MQPRLALTAGDPAGIGPEIIARAFVDGRFPPASYRIYTEAARFAESCRALGRASDTFGAHVEIVAVEAGERPRDFAPGRPSAYTGRIAAESVKAAARDAMAGRVDALVTAPLAKSALRAARVIHPGHTEFLAELAGVADVAMMFVAEELRLTLATIHVPLAQVPRVLTPERIGVTLRLTHDGLTRLAKISSPRIAVLGLNPHAGEEGLFGDEESRIITPAIHAAREAGLAVEGPFPADSFFARHQGEFDAVVAMYHDQGLIPVKILSRGRAVNVTLGLPFLRTSVDHGTAFDLAGTGRASPDSLVAAAELAARWAQPLDRSARRT